MHIEIEWPGGRTPVDLGNGSIRVGSDEGCDISLAGIPPECLRLEVAGDGAVVRGTVPLRVGPAWLTPGTPRLLLRGERVRLGGGAFLARPPPEEPMSCDEQRRVDTCELAHQLLATGDLSAGASPELATAGRAATLTCLSGDQLGAVFPLARAEVLVGRDSGVDLLLSEPSVSRHHARFVQHLHARPPSVEVHEVRSTNGVFVNGQRVRGAVCLSTGDVVELGAVHLRFEAPLVDSTLLLLPRGSEGETVLLASAAPRPARGDRANRGETDSTRPRRLCDAAGDSTVIDLPPAQPRPNQVRAPARGPAPEQHPRARRSAASPAGPAQPKAVPRPRPSARVGTGGTSGGLVPGWSARVKHWLAALSGHRAGSSGCRDGR